MGMTKNRNCYVPRYRLALECWLSLMLSASALLAQDMTLDLDEPAARDKAPGTEAPTAGTGLASVKAPLVGYTVPAFGSQRVLPGGPAVGMTTNALDLIAARGETESVSFVLRAEADVQQVTLTVGDLASPTGRLAVAQIDLRLVKCWYQSGNAWFTIEGDPESPTLIPELLLHDDGLVACSIRDRKNQFRIQGQYATLPTADSRPDDDAASLQPFALRAGQAQQLWMNVHVPVAAPPGIYHGTVGLSADGKSAGAIAITLRVLPFELPPPRPRHDSTRAFTVVLSHGLSLQSLDADRTKAEIRLRAAFADMARHHVLHPLAPDFNGDLELAKRELELRREAGVSNQPLWIADAAAVAAWQYPVREQYDAATAAESATRFKNAASLAGHKDVYLYILTGKPVPVNLVATLEQIKQTGAKLWLQGEESTINTLGYLTDAHQFHQMATARQIWARHTVGSRVIWGGVPSPGVENPETWRRLTGLVPFHAGYDGVAIPGYAELSNPWVDDANGYTRSRSLVYPTLSGWVGTLAWEAVREAVDDVRYFTLLNELVAKCLASRHPLVVIEGRRASLWLHLAKVDTANLDTLRLDAIAWILKLQLALAVGEGEAHQ